MPLSAVRRVTAIAWASCFGMLLSLAPALAAPPAPAKAVVWTSQGAPAALPGVLGLQVQRWQSERPTQGATDRVQLNRYCPASPDWPGGPALLYLPGTFMNGQVALTDEDYNLWLFLARRGVDVYTLDYRTHFLPRGEALDDPSQLRAWTSEAFVADVTAAADQVRTISGQSQIFVAGFSRGVFYAYAYASSHPDRVAGVVALDGFFKAHKQPPSPEAAGFQRDAVLAQLEASGNYAQDVGGSRGWEVRQKIFLRAAEDPSFEAVEDGRDTGQAENVGEQVKLMLYQTMGGGGALANALEGYSSVRTLSRLLADYDRYFPAIQDVETMSLVLQADDPLTTLDDHWAGCDVPVLFVGSGNFGADFLLNGIHSAVHCGGNETEIRLLEEQGHLDVLVGARAVEEVYIPVLEWLRGQAATTSE